MSVRRTRRSMIEASEELADVDGRQAALSQVAAACMDYIDAFAEDPAGVEGNVDLRAGVLLAAVGVLYRENAVGQRDPHQPMNPWPLAPTLVRSAIDLVLRTHPGFDLLQVDYQLPDDDAGRLDPGPWVLVTLGQPSQGDRPDGVVTAWARHQFAIWKTTGAVHGVQHDGSVTDDPLFTIG